MVPFELRMGFSSLLSTGRGTWHQGHEGRMIKKKPFCCLGS